MCGAGAMSGMVVCVFTPKNSGKRPSQKKGVRNKLEREGKGGSKS